MKIINQSNKRRISWLLIVAMQHASIAPVFAAPRQVTPLPSTGSFHLGSEAGQTGNTSTYKVNGTTGTVTQVPTKAIYNWDTFDINTGYTLQFVQPANGVALNKINDINPSLINGSLKANGAIYLINHNGIIFGGTAQVNVGSLVASTLDVDDDLFLHSSLAAAIDQQKPAFSGADMGFVEIDAKAHISSTDANGVMIFAPQITNAGTIETPDAQTILAASHGKVYLTPSTPAPNNSPDLRGFLVEVDSGGKVENLGQIIAERGNITLLGMAVNQDGLVRATTAAGVGQNGSIRLLARDGASDAGILSQSQVGTYVSSGAAGPLVGTLAAQNAAQARNTKFTDSAAGVHIGANSTTEVVPDETSEAVPDASLQSRSVVEVMAQKITVGDGATVRAPSGLISVKATSDPTLNNLGQNSSTDASITIGKNVTIDASGTQTTVHSAQDAVVDAKLVGTELADSPLQRNGVLSRYTIKVDADKGTNVANISGEMQNILRSADEKLSTGGNIKLYSEGSVAIDNSAVLDVSGGKTTYLAGPKTTTYVHGNGRWTEISDADPNVVYDKVTDVTRNAPGYVVGKNAGSIDITANTAPALGPNVLRGGVVIGPTQTDPSKTPKPGVFTLTLNNWASSDPITIVNQANFHSLNGEIADSLFRNSGLGSVTINSGGNVTFTENSEVDLVAGGSLAVNAKQSGNVSTPAPIAVQVDGTIKIRGGNVSLTASPQNDTNTAPKTSVVLGNHASILTQGDWINEYGSKTITPSAHIIDGGNIALSAGDLLLQPGSVLDASGGAYFNQSGKLTAGNGGDIALIANYLSNNGNQINGAQLQLGADMRSYSLTQGGQLSLTSNGFVIGNAGTAVDPLQFLLTPDFFARGGFSKYSLTNTAGDIRVASGTQLNLIANNWTYDSNLLRQKSGIDIAPFMRVSTLPAYLRKPVDLAINVQKPSASVVGSNINPKLVIENGASINGEPGAKINLSSSSQQILIDGSISAPAGAINVVLNSGSESAFDPQQAIVLGKNAKLTASAAFVAVPNLKQPNQRLYQTYNGGTISLTAKNGYVLAEQGSSIDVSGDLRTEDLRTIDSLGRSAWQTVVQTADAGTIHLEAAESILLDGDLRAQAATSGARGGRLEVVLNTNNSGNTRLSNSAHVPLASTITVTQNTDSNSISQSLIQRVNGAISGIGDIWNALSSNAASVKNNSTLLSADKIIAGGFQQLALTATNTKNPLSSSNVGLQLGQIVFDGNVNLALAQSIELNSNSLSVKNGGNTTISAPYISWGVDPNAQNFIAGTNAATGGSGSLTLHAQGLLDLVGNLSTLGTANVTVISDGDIRARGSSNFNTTTKKYDGGQLASVGNLTLQAQQIYPPTLQNFEFKVIPDNTGAGVLAIKPVAGTPGVVYSAGGSLTFTAPTIVQGGTVKAPLGSITFNAADSLQLQNGSLTSVALDAALVPFGHVDDINGWTYGNLVYSLTPDASVTNQVLLPQKSITLQAPTNITVDKDAVIDVHGGGDVYAWQFIAGPGGSKDILDSKVSTTSFAILPISQLKYAPIDTLDAAAGSSVVGKTLTLQLGGGVTQTYAILPARYALLPGAELVTPVASYNNLADGSVLHLQNGATIYKGTTGVANANVGDSVATAFSVLTRDQVLQRSEYDIRTGSNYFDQASSARGTGDAGLLQILANNGLSIAGTLRAAGADGARGGAVDIQANNITVVDQPGSQSGTGVQLLSSQLNNLGAESLLLGGVRQATGTGTQITANATNVTIDSNTKLSLPEIILAAKDTIQILDGASLTASGARVPTTNDTINLNGESALVRVSSLNQAVIKRTGLPSTPTKGSVTLAATAQLIAQNTANAQSGAIAVDVAKNGSLNGAINANGGALSFSAPTLNIGGGGSANALALSTSQLNGANAAQILLSSKGNVDFYSGLSLQADDIEIAGNALRSMSSANDTLTIRGNKSVTLTGIGVAPIANSIGTTALNITAPNIILNGAAPIDTNGNSAAATNLVLNGFSSIAMNSQTSTIARGNLAVNTASKIAITTPQLTSENGANLTLASSDDLAIGVGAGQQPDTATTHGYAGSVALSGKKVSVDTAVLLPGKQFNVRATGTDPSTTIAFGSNARVDVAGRIITVGDKTLAMSGGNVAVDAGNGSIVFDSASGFDVSGTLLGGDAGSISFTSSHAAMNVNTQLKGAAVTGSNGGSLSLDALSFSNLRDIFHQQNTGGFTGGFTLRQRAGDLTVGSGDSVVAKKIDIAADQGVINVNGTLNASGDKGGTVNVAAGTDLNINSGAKILANATSSDGNGGKVNLSARDGWMTLADNSLIDLRSGANGVGGTLNLRVPRTQSDNSAQGAHIIGSSEIGDGAAITHFGSTVTGARSLSIEAVKTYLASQVSAVLDGIVQPETTQFMTDASSWIATKLNGAPAITRLLPGVEIYNNDSSVNNGNLDVDEAIDLFSNNGGDWHYGSDNSIPGVLTLRAVNNINVQNSISDGFAQAGVLAPGIDASCIQSSLGCSTLTNIDSWSLRLISGADFTAANVTQTKAAAAGTGSIFLENDPNNIDPISGIAYGAYVRTGSGDIAIASGGDLIFHDATAAIYTAGRSVPYQITAAGSTQKLGYSAADFDTLGFSFPMPTYAEGGGDVSVKTQGNITVTNTQVPAIAAEWLQRITDTSASAPATWAVVPTNFHGGVGALGGGNVDVSANGSIKYLSVAAPTTGQQIGLIDHTGGNLALDANSQSQVIIRGGGDVSVSAGKDILSSSFYAMRGNLAVKAGGSLAQASDSQVANLFGVADTKANIAAKNSMVIAAVYNPTASLQYNPALGFTANSYFFTYTKDSSITLSAATGDLKLKNNLQDTFAQYSSIYPGYSDSEVNNIAGAAAALDVYPATVNAFAPQGNISIGRSVNATVGGMALFPAPSGNLQMVAGKNITGDNNVRVAIGDGDADKLPGLQAASAGAVSVVLELSAAAIEVGSDLITQVLGLSDGTDNHSKSILHAGDTTTAELVAGSGDIAVNGSDNPFTIYSGKSLRAYAGRDVRNTRFILQNVSAGDVSRISAGRDIIFSGQAGRSYNGSIEINGPGHLDLLAGRNIDLGTGIGVISQGNLKNAALPATGATITAMAGLGTASLDYTNFFKKYIDNATLLNYLNPDRVPDPDHPNDIFGGDLIGYTAAITGVYYKDRASAFQGLQQFLANGDPDNKVAQVFGKATDDMRALVLKVFYNEVTQGGVSAVDPNGGEGYTRSYRAIDTLFPNTNYSGDIRLVQSSLQSNGGGDIDMIAPGGNIDVGLPVAVSSTANNVQGVVVSGKGSINAYVKNDINVNRSKVIVQNGGDIMLFSRFGNIDAGRGARTALVLPPPTISFDSSGNLIISSPPAISGSGIQAACSTAECKEAHKVNKQNVYLFAPNGVIDAGDAGISSAGNLFLGAEHIIHNDVISAAGSTFGAPAAPTVDIGLGAGDVAASAVQSAQETAAAAATGGDQGPLGQRGLALLTVDILGYGSSQEDDKNRQHQ